MKERQGTQEINLDPERLKGMSARQLDVTANRFLKGRFPAEELGSPILRRSRDIIPQDPDALSKVTGVLGGSEGPEMFAIGLQTREEALVASGGRLEDLL